MKIVSDKSEGDGKVKAKEVWRRAEWDEFQAMEAAVVAANRVRKTAEAAEAASEEAVARAQSARISRAGVSLEFPPGLVTPGVAMTKQPAASFNKALVVKAPAHMRRPSSWWTMCERQKLEQEDRAQVRLNEQTLRYN